MRRLGSIWLFANNEVQNLLVEVEALGSEGAGFVGIDGDVAFIREVANGVVDGGDVAVDELADFFFGERLFKQQDDDVGICWGHFVFEGMRCAEDIAHEEDVLAEGRKDGIHLEVRRTNYELRIWGGDVQGDGFDVGDVEGCRAKMILDDAVCYENHYKLFHEGYYAVYFRGRYYCF